MRDPYLAARIEDIRVVGTRLIRNLIKKPYVAYSAVPDGAVILAEELTPADTALMDPQRIAGFATVFGGAESHTAIVARALGLPAVLAVPGLLDRRAGRRHGGDRRHRGLRDHRSVGARRSANTRRGATLWRANGAVSARLRRLPAVDPRRGRDHPRSQSRTAGRARAGAGQRRDGARPRPLRVPLHEPRRPAGRGGAVRGLLGAGARHGAESR